MAETDVGSLLAAQSWTRALGVSDLSAGALDVLDALDYALDDDVGVVCILSFLPLTLTHHPHPHPHPPPPPIFFFSLPRSPSPPAITPRLLGSSRAKPLCCCHCKR